MIAMLGKRPFTGKSDEMDKYLDEEDARRARPAGVVAPPPPPEETGTPVPGGEPVVAAKP